MTATTHHPHARLCVDIGRPFPWSAAVSQAAARIVTTGTVTWGAVATIEYRAPSGSSAIYSRQLCRKQ
jgi:hypothetical protein